MIKVFACLNYATTILGMDRTGYWLVDVVEPIFINLEDDLVHRKYHCTLNHLETMK